VSVLSARSKRVGHRLSWHCCHFYSWGCPVQALLERVFSGLRSAAVRRTPARTRRRAVHCKVRKWFCRVSWKCFSPQGMGLDYGHSPEDVCDEW